MTWDVIISGAGIIGVSLALELRRRGARVLVFDAGEPGQEASASAAGMLAANDPETPEKLRPLARESDTLYPGFVEELESASGIAVDFRYGTVVLGPSLHPGARGLENISGHQPIAWDELKQLEPALNACGYPAYLIPSEKSIDPRLLMRAALRAAQSVGIEIRGHTPVQAMSSSGSQVEVVTGKDRFRARAAVNCQGAWAGAPVRPRKGQLIYVQPRNPELLHRVVRAPGVYMVPRSSGRILVGATVEDIGFDKTVVQQTIQQLQRAAAQFVPELASVPITLSWAGLRPGTPDELPILGRLEAPGVFIASGHFRNGILLAPITAKITADLIAEKAPALDIGAFSPSRFATATATT
jgi:glycine oxidase